MRKDARIRILPLRSAADHFFDGKIEPLMSAISTYLDKRLGTKGGDRRNSAARGLWVG